MPLRPRFNCINEWSTKLLIYTCSYVTLLTMLYCRKEQLIAVSVLEAAQIHNVYTRFRGILSHKNFARTVIYPVRRNHVLNKPSVVFRRAYQHHSIVISM